MTDNLSLWHAVEKTPVEHTKQITGKSYQGNSPKPHWLVRRATEQFGPVGIGWGFTVVDERIEEGAGGEKLHIARVKVWYKWDGERGEVEHIGGTVFSGTRSNGKTFTDEDAPKKSVTDALVKALSFIGFAGDIFLGRYDDSKYLTELREEAAEAKREAKPSQTAKQEAQKPADTIPPKHVNYDTLVKELKLCTMAADIGRAWRDNEFVTLREQMPPYWQAKLKDEATRIGNELKAKEAAAKSKDTVDTILETFPGSRVTDEKIHNVEGRELHPMEGM